MWMVVVGYQPIYIVSVVCAPSVVSLECYLLCLQRGCASVRFILLGKADCILEFRTSSVRAGLYCINTPSQLCFCCHVV